MQQRVFAQQETSAACEQAFLASLKDLLDGFTELKIHRQKSDDLYENGIRRLGKQAIEAKRAIEDTTIRGTVLFATYGFLPVGAVIFLLPRFDAVSTEQLVKLIAVTLFSLGPLMGLVMTIPMISGNPPTLWWLLMTAEGPLKDSDSMTSG